MNGSRRQLGSSGMEVSRFALGSWRTFERISAEAGLAVMRAARDAGINFLDDARYNDETGTAPIPTGYSEVLFGELFRKAGWPRDETVVCNKLWWEFWPDQTAEQELDGSLGRMQLDHVDVIYANPPPDGLYLPELVSSVANLVTAGKARAWAIVNWQADQLLELSHEADRQGVAQPCAAQLPYSLIRRSWVDDAGMKRALEACGAPIVASYALAGGVLTGKYDADPAAGRAADALDEPLYVDATRAGRDVAALAETVGASPATLAVAFAFTNPAVASALFGATRPEQVRENTAALDLLDQLDESQLAQLCSIGT